MGRINSLRSNWTVDLDWFLSAWEVTLTIHISAHNMNFRKSHLTKSLLCLQQYNRIRKSWLWALDLWNKSIDSRIITGIQHIKSGGGLVQKSNIAYYLTCQFLKFIIILMCNERDWARYLSACWNWENPSRRIDHSRLNRHARAQIAGSSTSSAPPSGMAVSETDWERASHQTRVEEWARAHELHREVLALCTLTGSKSQSRPWSSTSLRLYQPLYPTGETVPDRSLPPLPEKSAQNLASGLLVSPIRLARDQAKTSFFKAQTNSSTQYRASHHLKSS